jgi:hypothetical protein
MYKEGLPAAWILLDIAVYPVVSDNLEHSCNNYRLRPAIWPCLRNDLWRQNVMETLIVRMCGTQTECHFHIHDFFLALLISFTLASKFTLNSSQNNYCIIIYLLLSFLGHCINCRVYLRSVLLTLNFTEFQDDGG